MQTGKTVWDKCHRNGRMWQEIMEVFWDRLGWIGLAAKWSTQSKEKIRKKHTENSYFVKCPLQYVQLVYLFLQQDLPTYIKCTGSSIYEYGLICILPAYCTCLYKVFMCREATLDSRTDWAEHQYKSQVQVAHQCATDHSTILIVPCYI